MKVKSESEVAQSCLTLSDPMDCSLPGSSIHGIFQARVLEWGAISFSVNKIYQVSSTIGSLGNELIHTKIHAFLLCMIFSYFNHVGCALGTLVCQKVRCGNGSTDCEIHFLCFEIKACLYFKAQKMDSISKTTWGSHLDYKIELE